MIRRAKSLLRRWKARRLREEAAICEGARGDALSARDLARNRRMAASLRIRATWLELGA
jgi:hypothetical protein